MRSPSGEAAERAAADALDRYWDGLTLTHALTTPGGGPTSQDEALDLALTRSVRQLRLLDATPHPEPGFANRLWADLMTGQASPAPAPPPAPSVVGRLSSLSRHRFLVELTVAAALLLVLFGGGAALKLPVALDPASPTVAASAATSATVEATVLSGCAQTVTPEPTQAALQHFAASEPAQQPLPTVPVAAAVSC